jgi:3-polyprenyl-4-hydroxybenzoate decarboxylase
MLRIIRGKVTKVWYIRNPEVSVVWHLRDLMCVPASGASLQRLRLNNSAEFVRLILAVLREPRSFEELCCTSRCDAAKMQALLTLLVKERVLICDDASRIQSVVSAAGTRLGETLPCQSLVIGVCGTIYASVVLHLILALKRSFANHIDVVLTESAKRFLKPQVLAYFGMEVWQDAYHTRDGIAVPHIHLASKAELVLIMPASARTIHRIATGECSDLLSLVVAATRAPVVVVPAMNPNMFDFSPIKQNLDRLKSAGMYVIEPGLAYEASKERGDALSFSGVGLRDGTLLPTLAAILAIERKSKGSSKEPLKDESMVPLEPHNGTVPSHSS